MTSLYFNADSDWRKVPNTQGINWGFPYKLSDNSFIVVGTNNDTNESNLYRSDDGGRTFNIVPDTVNKFNNSFLTLADGSILVLGTRDSDSRASKELYKSNDGGVTWSLYSANVSITGTLFQLKNDNVFANVINSADNGSTTVDLYQIYPNNTPTKIKDDFKLDSKFIVEPQDGVVLGINDNPSVQKVYRSADWGMTWSQITGSNDNALRLGMVGSNIFFVTNTTNAEKRKLFKSTDSGVTWTEVTYTGASDLKSIRFTPLNMIAGYDADSGPILTKSSDGDVWSDTEVACSEDANTMCSVSILYIENDIVYAFKVTASIVDGNTDMSSMKSEIYVSTDSGNTFQKNGEINEGLRYD